MRVTLSSKGQLVIPKPIREHLGWDAGKELEVVERGDHLVVRLASEPRKLVIRPTTVDEVFGSAGYRGPVRTMEEMDAGIAAAVEERLRRSP